MSSIPYHECNKVVYFHVTATLNFALFKAHESSPTYLIIVLSIYHYCSITYSTFGFVFDCINYHCLCRFNQLLLTKSSLLASRY